MGTLYPDCGFICLYIVHYYVFSLHIILYSPGCNDWVDLSGNRTCHDCSRFSTAASCLREFRCGWCGNVYNPTLGKCIEGDFSGRSTIGVKI